MPRQRRRVAVVHEIAPGRDAEILRRDIVFLDGEQPGKFSLGPAIELPLVAFYLTRAGIINSRMLSSKRRYAVLGIFILIQVSLLRSWLTSILMWWWIGLPSTVRM